MAEPHGICLLRDCQRSTPQQQEAILENYIFVQVEEVLLLGDAKAHSPNTDIAALHIELSAALETARAGSVINKGTPGSNLCFPPGYEWAFSLH